MTRNPERDRTGEQPLPRDPQPQQARDDHDEDPLAIPVPEGTADDDELPGPDQAGSGPRRRPERGTVHPEHPTPQEPTG